MAGKGSPKGVRRGGRQKGTPNRSSKEREARVREAGATPLDGMLASMRWHLKRANKAMAIAARQTAKQVKAIKDADAKAEIPPELEIGISPLDGFIAAELACVNEHGAKAAAYVHPKLASVEHSRTIDYTRYSDDELRYLERLALKQLSDSARKALEGARSGASEAVGGAPSTRH